MVSYKLFVKRKDLFSRDFEIFDSKINPILNDFTWNFNFNKIRMIEK